MIKSLTFSVDSEMVHIFILTNNIFIYRAECQYEVSMTRLITWAPPSLTVTCTALLLAP